MLREIFGKHGRKRPTGETALIGKNESAIKKERLGRLTTREKEEFILLLTGYTIRESAEKLGISYSTANTHLSAIYKKLEVNSRAQLIIMYHDECKTQED